MRSSKTLEDTEVKIEQFIEVICKNMIQDMNIILDMHAGPSIVVNCPMKHKIEQFYDWEFYILHRQLLLFTYAFYLISFSFTRDTHILLSLSNLPNIEFCN